MHVLKGWIRKVQPNFMRRQTPRSLDDSWIYRHACAIPVCTEFQSDGRKNCNQVLRVGRWRRARVLSIQWLKNTKTLEPDKHQGLLTVHLQVGNNVIVLFWTRYHHSACSTTTNNNKNRWSIFLGFWWSNSFQKTVRFRSLFVGPSMHPPVIIAQHKDLKMQPHTNKKSNNNNLKRGIISISTSLPYLLAALWPFCPPPKKRIKKQNKNKNTQKRKKFHLGCS